MMTCKWFRQSTDGETCANSVIDMSFIRSDSLECSNA